jgi:20S proteasome alpha/beta subunit
MKGRITGAVCALLFMSLTALGGQNLEDDSVVRGTINIALGNENGLVVLTDSMISVGGVPKPDIPSQKLFKLDDRTVCAIAGFASAAAVSAPSVSPQASLPDLNTSASAIIHEYIRQSAMQAPQSMTERLRTLAFLMSRHLSAIANVRDAIGNPTPLDNYRFQLIIAGYDTDGKPKIGKITLRMDSDRGSFSSEIDEAAILNIEKKLVVQLNGMPDVAQQILLHPESKAGDPTINQYAASLAENGGSTLTVDQMVELAKRLAYFTSVIHPQVGGLNQIAVFEKPHGVRIEQQKFPDPPKPLINFSLVVNSYFSYSSIAIAKGVSAIFARCSWAGMQRELDGNYFIGNDFRDSVLAYDGGVVNLGDTNRMTNSVLVIGPHASPADETARRLMKAFAWSQVRYIPPEDKPWKGVPFRFPE